MGGDSRRARGGGQVVGPWAEAFAEDGQAVFASVHFGYIGQGAPRGEAEGLQQAEFLQRQLCLKKLQKD